MDRQKLTQWTQILEKITANMTLEIAKPLADFVFNISQNLTDNLENDEDNKFFIPKILPLLKKIQPILQNDFSSVTAKFSGTYENSAWKEIISQIEEIQDDTTEKASKIFVLSLKKQLFDNGEEYVKMPILFTPFCRAETATKVFSAIKKSKPKRLYVFSDGWRKEKEGEKEKVEYLRKYILDNMDWDCELFTKFEDKNLGPRFGLESAFDWFFENEEMGIILEDDCLPAPEFFRFCSEILIKYKDEEKVSLINGTNGYPEEISSNTYSFKKVTDFTEDAVGIWGWATWRRVWNKHDKMMSQLDKYKKQCDVDENSLNFDEYLKITRIKFLSKQLEMILADSNNTWDLQLRFSILINDGLLIIPNCNLISNIGCGVADSVHGTAEYSVAATLATGEFFFPVEHPQEISARPLTVKEYLQAVYTVILPEKELWEKEFNITHSMAVINGVLKGSKLDDEKKKEICEPAFSNSLDSILKHCLSGGNYGKAQKYLHLALSKSLFDGKKNFCSKCLYRECLSGCPTKSIVESKAKDEEFIVKINRETCEYCWKCMRLCRAVNPDIEFNKNEYLDKQKAKTVDEKKVEIRKYFLNLNESEQEKEIVEIIDYFKKYSFSVFPYEFQKKYRPSDINVYYDKESKTGYVEVEKKALYFPDGWRPEKIKPYYSNLRMEQDPDSPHRYETEEFTVKYGDVIADVGTAEGIWALQNVERASKVYLFECEEKWIKTLERTFAPWKEKVVIIKKYVSDKVDKDNITLDECFKGQEIDFIKADIEGYETKMLEGSKETLKNNDKLKMLLCTYHKRNDAVEIKDFLEKHGFSTEFSKRYMLFVLDEELQEPWVRRGLIRAKR